MRLFIAEKPELARAIAAGLGGGVKRGGYIECAGDDVVTWCFGHMLQLAEPEHYDKKFAQWNAEDLPFIFVPWKKIANPSSREQLKVIASLLSRADEAVNAGDPDAEGQLLIDETLAYFQFRKPVRRVLINDLTPEIVKKSLAHLRDNSEFAGLSAAAEARQVADQLYGFNLTRLYTLTARAAGSLPKGAALSVGRVQTPILGLVVRRCRENADHKSAFYYLVNGDFSFGELNFSARYVNRDTDALDDKKRLLDAARATAIATAATGADAEIIASATTEKFTPPPLPYNLLKLQTDAARLYKFKPDYVKDVTQTLREKHHLITYNRSDCQYLSEEQHGDAPQVLAAIAATNPDLADAVNGADTKIQGRVFDSSKITAHHAIIPTISTAKFDNLSTDEQKIYTLIARRYALQFFPPYRYEQSEIQIQVGEDIFRAVSHVPLARGWKAAASDTFDAKEKSDDEAAENAETATSISLKNLTTADRGKCVRAQAEKQATKPRPLYTMATLLGDLTKVAQYIKDERLKKLLLDKDKDKAGEHGGIGTPATRDTIIKTLFERGFIAETKGKIVSTDKGKEFYDTLPDAAKYPDMTALWHAQQREIEAGKLTVEKFIAEAIGGYLRAEVERIKRAGLSMTVKTDASKPKAEIIAVDNAPVCAGCGAKMRLIKTAAAEFFSCENFRQKPECKPTISAKDGKPLVKKPADLSEIHHCLKCGKPLIKRANKNDASKFWWGCSGYPACSERYFDRDGAPDFSSVKKNAAPEKRAGKKP